MSKPSSDEKSSSNIPPSAVNFMLLTIADTTWRMFVPTVGLMGLGYWADGQLGTWPWLFIAGVVVGFAIAGLLIMQQLRVKL